MKLTLNANIYSRQVVEVAIIAYKDLAEITVIQNEEQIQLTFDNCRFDPSMTIKEFENYLIGLENS